MYVYKMYIVRSVLLCQRRQRHVRLQYTLFRKFPYWRAPKPMTLFQFFVVIIIAIICFVRFLFSLHNQILLRMFLSLVSMRQSIHFYVFFFGILWMAIWPVYVLVPISSINTKYWHFHYIWIWFDRKSKQQNTHLHEWRIWVTTHIV